MNIRFAVGVILGSTLFFVLFALLAACIFPVLLVVSLLCIGKKPVSD